MAVINDWRALGARIAQARRAAHLSQAEVANALGVDRTVVTKIEAGTRGTSALELARLARILGRSIDWFLLPSPPAVASRRNERGADESEADIVLERVAREIDLLVEQGLLSVPPAPTPMRIDSVGAAEEAAAKVRRGLGLGVGPVWDLPHLAEKVGLYVYVLRLSTPDLDGSYLRVGAGGVAIINGAVDSGRRRFNLVHELGHHLFADDYSTEWIIAEGGEAREKLINAFAIHFLMPRRVVERAWREGGGEEHPRRVALHLAAEYGVSWTATVGQLRNLKLIDAEAFERLKEEHPRRIDYIEERLSVRTDLHPPLIPPSVGQVVLRAYRRNKLGRSRALELMHGTVAEHELPDPFEVPAESMIDQLHLE